MSALEYEIYLEEPKRPDLTIQLPQDFSDNLSKRAHGSNIDQLILPKENVKKVLLDFAYNMMPKEATDIAPIAHLAELSHNSTFGKNIRRSFNETVLENTDVDDEQQLYLSALFSDLSILADYAKRTYADNPNTLDLRGLADIIQSVNIESIALKAALDMSNFRLLEGRENPTQKEQEKMRRVMASIRHIDSILLEVLGFDALAAKMLSKVYSYELKHQGDQQYVDAANAFFDRLNSQVDLKSEGERIVRDLFADNNPDQYSVIENQEDHNVYFTDGKVGVPDVDETFRVLTRVKTIGSTAVKMRNHAKYFNEIRTPADIIGMTFIGADNENVQQILHHTLEQIESHGIELVDAPGRDTNVHIKGSQEFLNFFNRPSSPLVNRDDIRVRTELCDNGYEAVKITMTKGDCPIEMQFTHETARKASRTGLGSHTLFKLQKLLGIDIDSDMDDDEIITILEETSRRKKDFNQDNLEIVPDSKARAEQLIQLTRREAVKREIELTEALGRHSSNFLSPVI